MKVKMWAMFVWGFCGANLINRYENGMSDGLTPLHEVLAVCIVIVFAFSSAHAGDKQFHSTLVLTCVPTDVSGFGFRVSQNSGCQFAPGGAICGNNVGLAALRFNVSDKIWQPTLFEDMKGSLSVDKANQNLNYMSQTGVLASATMCRSMVIRLNSI